MFAPPLYVVRKFPLSFIISNNFNIQLEPDDEKRFQVKQGDNMLFRQVRLITYETEKFNRFVVFVNCVGGQNKKKEMTRLIHHGFKVGKQEFVVSGYPEFCGQADRQGTGQAYHDGNNF